MTQRAGVKDPHEPAPFFSAASVVRSAGGKGDQKVQAQAEDRSGAGDSASSSSAKDVAHGLGSLSPILGRQPVAAQGHAPLPRDVSRDALIRQLLCAETQGLIDRMYATYSLLSKDFDFVDPCLAASSKPWLQRRSAQTENCLKLAVLSALVGDPDYKLLDCLVISELLIPRCAAPRTWRDTMPRPHTGPMVFRSSSSSSSVEPVDLVTAMSPEPGAGTHGQDREAKQAPTGPSPESRVQEACQRLPDTQGRQRLLDPPDRSVQTRPVAAKGTEASSPPGCRPAPIPSKAGSLRTAASAAVSASTSASGSTAPPPCSLAPRLSEAPRKAAEAAPLVSREVRGSGGAGRPSDIDRAVRASLQGTRRPDIVVHSRTTQCTLLMELKFVALTDVVGPPDFVLGPERSVSCVLDRLTKLSDAQVAELRIVPASIRHGDGRAVRPLVPGWPPSGEPASMECTAQGMALGDYVREVHRLRTLGYTWLLGQSHPFFGPWPGAAAAAVAAAAASAEPRPRSGRGPGDAPQRWPTVTSVTAVLLGPRLLTVQTIQSRPGTAEEPPFFDARVM